jgi:hypothetical protein
MFKFTIRELLLLTLSAALALGWYLRERQLQDDVANGQKWRDAVGLFEHAMRSDGWRPEWQPDGIRFNKKPGLSEFQRAVPPSLDGEVFFESKYGSFKPSTDLP